METSGPRTAQRASPDLFSLFAHEIQRPRTSRWQKYPPSSDRAWIGGDITSHESVSRPRHVPGLPSRKSSGPQGELLSSEASTTSATGVHPRLQSEQVVRPAGL